MRIAIWEFVPDPDVKLSAMNRPVESCSVERLYTTPITSQLPDRLEHQVTDEAAAVGRKSPLYQALCGQLFVAAPLAAPPCRPCPDCAAILATASRAAAARQPRHRRHGLLRWLLNRA
ncbi:MAG: hypothetical protein ACRDTD_04045 [Pseudonocardiaceae bacterium]